jgi:hypothetical protein
MLNEQFYGVLQAWLGQALKIDEMGTACILYAHMGYPNITKLKKKEA